MGKAGFQCLLIHLSTSLYNILDITAVILLLPNGKQICHYVYMGMYLESLFDSIFIYLLLISIFLLLYICIYHNLCSCMYGEFVSLYNCLMHAMGMPQVAELRQWWHHYLPLTSGLVKYEAVLHNCGRNPGGDGYRLVTVRTHDDFIVLPHWNTRLPAWWPAIPLSHIILTLNQPVFALSS